MDLGEARVGACPPSMVSLREAAELLGVHYMTVYRSVRLGRLPAEKAAGGIWCVRRDHVEHLRVRAEQLGSRPGTVSRPDAAAAPRRRVAWARRLQDRLVAGDEGGAWGVVESALASGTDVETLYLTVLAPAMRAIGQDWAEGRLDVATEHRATVIVTRIIGRLGPRFARRGRPRGAVLLGAPAGDQHALPGALLADLLRGAGFAVVELGANVPAESFVSAADRAERLVAAAVSATTPGNDRAIAATVQTLRAALPQEVLVLLGGGAVRGAAHVRSLGADGWARDARQAVALLEQRLAERRRA